MAGQANASFVARYKKRFGDDASTNMCVEASYFQLHLFAKALQQADTLDTEILRSMVLGTSFDAPQGAVTIDPVSGHADLWTRIGRADLYEAVMEYQRRDRRYGGLDPVDQK